MTEETAIKEIKKARKKHPSNRYQMIAILEDDIAHPFYEWSVSATTDQYRSICISCDHLTEPDRKRLNQLCLDRQNGMLMKRDTGWLIKLYDDHEYNLLYQGLSVFFKDILNTAFKSGFRMIEFDVDAKKYAEFDVF